MGGIDNKKVLIIDDSEQDQKLIKKLLAREGIVDVYTADTGIDGIFLAEEKKPTVVLVDTQLIGINGFDTCKRIKAIKKLKAKVIIMTGVIEAVDSKKARESGADQYCAKTRDCAKLIFAVKQFLQ